MNATATSALPSATPVPEAPSRGHDFADWLSPILVKELRQGMRSRVFVGIFIGVQAIMVTIIAIWLASYAAQGATSNDSRDGFFWALVGFALLIGMPLRGLVALSSEQKAQTLDLVQMTRLTAFRIALGKWLALVAQSGLLVVSVLPYAALRYFFGRVDVVNDLSSVAWMFSLSVFFTAFAVAASALGPIMRGVLVVGAVIVGQVAAAISAFAVSFSGRSSSSPFSFMLSSGAWSLEEVVVAGGLLAAYTWLCLEEAAAKIAPSAENHAARKRLGALTLLAFSLGTFAFFGSSDASQMAWALSAPFLAWVVIGALCEHTSSIPSLYAPWARRGVIARLAGRILYPGWATGTLFLLIVIGGWMSAPIIFATTSSGDHWIKEEALRASAVVLGLLFPLLVVVFTQTRPLVRFWMYVMIHALCILVVVVCSNLPGAYSALFVIGPLPHTIMAVVNESDYRNELMYFIICQLVTAGVLLLVLGWRSIREFKLMNQMERISLNPGSKHG